ncbi:MAG: ornithine cyclodeaminase [Candidatus Thermoplasmatota archaeon]|nr:ornithine cyclodeaminase [Candidatus Thermoplasmatota archaeon]
MYYITEREVSDNLDMKAAVGLMREAFEEYYKGNAGADPRQRTYSGPAVLSTMPAFMNKYQISGLKSYIGTKNGAKFVVLLFDTESTDLLAVVEAEKLGQIRTGAVTALATSILHDKCSVFTLIGSGFQAETQLEGILSVSDPIEIRVYSRTASHSKSFAQRMSKKFGREIKDYSDLGKALYNADVITCITSSYEPIIKDLSFSGRYHLNIAGSNILARREVSEAVIRDANLVVVEHLEQALRESSEISDFVNGGGKPVEFKEVVGESQKFSHLRKTIFKTMGIGLEDIICAWYVLDKMNLV